MRCHCPAVRQLLSEEDIVVGVDGEEVNRVIILCIYILTLVCLLRYSTAGIAEVTILKAFLDLLDSVIA